MNQAGTVAHPSVVLHMDIDYFYAQVEEVMNPELKDKPFGVQQGLNIVTCNYIARSFGVKKWRPISECLAKCPELVMVNGEDLGSYKVYSKKITELLHELIGPSERMGLDEHYMDITKLVEDELLAKREEDRDSLHLTGPFYPSEDAFSECSCGCKEKLMVGSAIAKKIREKILEDLKLTCSVGVAHNKLLAKLVGQLNKPDNQTTLAPTAASAFMIELKDLRSIMGIGGKTADRIEELGIKTIEELQNSDVKTLEKKFTAETAARLKEMSIGLDLSAVKPSGKPKTVGLEDSCPPISTRPEVLAMFHGLLPRLVSQIQDDGRIPQCIKVTIRQYDKVKKISVRETKQCALVPSNFRFVDGKLQLADGAEGKIMKSVANAFDHLVGCGQKFNVNLIGLCFNKFQEQKHGAGSIESFLVKKVDEDKFGQISTVNQTSPRSDETVEPTPKRVKLEATSKAPEIPSNIDPTVWAELPVEVQQELMRSWNLPTINLSESVTNDEKGCPKSSGKSTSESITKGSARGVSLVASKTSSKGTSNNSNKGSLLNHFKRK